MLRYRLNASINLTTTCTVPRGTRSKLSRHVWFVEASRKAQAESTDVMVPTQHSAICYGVVWGTAGADLFRHCLEYCSSRPVTALFGVLQEPICSASFGVLQEPICCGIVWGSAGADLLRHRLGYYRRGSNHSRHSQPKPRNTSSFGNTSYQENSVMTRPKMCG